MNEQHVHVYKKRIDIDWLLFNVPQEILHEYSVRELVQHWISKNHTEMG